LGSQADLNAGDARWLSPLSLWTGILAGPVAWALDLGISYAIVKWTCNARSEAVLHGVTIGTLAIVLVGVVTSWGALRSTTEDLPTDGGHPRQRARFMAILGLTSCALFLLTIVAGAIPRWVLDACS
jgi:hypothetical protein